MIPEADRTEVLTPGRSVKASVVEPVVAREPSLGAAYEMQQTSAVEPMVVNKIRTFAPRTRYLEYKAAS